MSDKLVPASFPQTSKEYGLSVVKGAIGAIPYVGGAINEVLFEARSRLKQQRLNEFFLGVAQQVAKLNEASIDQNFLRSEEFSDLLEEILLRVARTRSDKKRSRYGRALLGAFQGHFDPDFTTFFLGILDEISEAELKVLGEFITFLQEKKEYAARGEALDMGVIDYANSPWGFDGVTAKQIVQSLVAKGLLADDSHGRFDTEPFTVIIPTELGGRFVEWLAAGPSAIADPTPGPG